MPKPAAWLVIPIGIGLVRVFAEESKSGRPHTHVERLRQPNAIGHRRLFQVEFRSGRDLGEESVKVYGLDHFSMDFHPLIRGFIDPELSLHPLENPTLVVARFVSRPGLGVQNPTGVPVHLRLSGEVKFECADHFLQHLMTVSDSFWYLAMRRCRSRSDSFCLLSISRCNLRCSLTFSSRERGSSFIAVTRL